MQSIQVLFQPQSAKAIFLGPTVFLMMAMRQHNYIDSQKRIDHTSATATIPLAAMQLAVASLLSTSGYTNVTYMPGGVVEWAAQGYTFETGQDPGGVIPPTPIPPTVMSTDTSVTSSSVQLNGNLTALGTASSVTVSFEWGPTTSYGNMTTPEAKSAIGAFTASLTGLTPATTYHFRIKVVGNGTTYGNDTTFTTALLPASFTLTNFNIAPSTSKVGGMVNISVTCTNTGGISGTYPVIFKINSVLKQIETVNLDPGKSQLVTYAITESKSGTYEANVNELTSSFVVQKSPKPYWILIVEILGGIIVVSLLVLFIFRRRRIRYNDRFWDRFWK